MKKAASKKPAPVCDEKRYFRRLAEYGRFTTIGGTYYSRDLEMYHGREVIVEEVGERPPFVWLYDLDGQPFMQVYRHPVQVEMDREYDYMCNLLDIREKGGAFPPVPEALAERRRFFRALCRLQDHHDYIPDEYRVFYRKFKKRPE